MGTVSYLKNKFKELPKAKKLFVILFAFVLLGGSTWAGYVFGLKKLNVLDRVLSPKGVIISGQPAEPRNFPNPINGLLFKKSEASVWVNQVPIGVMIENSTEARPQRGLSKADIVYEALVEGDITRFLAIYFSQTAQVAPIRSARGYYMDWVSEYQAGYAHWGGNQGVRVQADQYFGKKNLDQFEIGAPTFYRLPSDGGEHTGTSTIDNLRTVETQRGVNSTVNLESWKFKDDKPVNPPTIPIINVGFAGSYAVRWEYDAATNNYKRFNGGIAQMDKEYNVQLTFKDIIVEFMQDNGYKKVTGVDNRDFTTIGSGKAKIFQDGSLIEGSWKKDSREGRTKFFDSSGKEVLLNRGPIWMEMLPEGTTVN